MRGLADHCPEDRQAVGEAETTLAGITFERGGFPKVLKRYGPADAKREYTDATYPQGSGEATYSWTIDRGHLEVSTMFYHRDRSLVESVIAVRIEGDSDIPEWQTGKGLRLGDDFERVVLLYGSVFLEGNARGSKPVSHSMTICFSNETRLGVELNDVGKIMAIRLMPSIE
jgi:hypothetical protein